MHISRPLLNIVVNLLAICASGPQTFAQRPDPRNAATWYQRAIEQFDRAYTPEQREAISTYLDHPNDAPSQEVRALLARADSIMAIVRRGSVQERADFGLDRTQGFELLLPHLGPMRQIIRIMSAEATMRMHDGDVNGAAQRIADMYRVSGHCGDDRILISSLVGQAVFSSADTTLQRALDRGIIGPDEAAGMLSGLKSLPTADPFNYVEAVASEQELAVTWLTDKFLDPEHRADIPAMFNLAADDPNAQQFLALDEERLQAEIDKYDSMMARVVEAFSMTDPEQGRQAIADLQKEVESGEAGVLAHILFPSFGRCFDNKVKGEKMLADRIAVLEGFITGQVTVADTANAAQWYLRAIAALEQIDEAKLQALRDLAAAPSNPLSDDVRAALRDVQSAMAIALEAAAIKRCDFSIARQRDQVLFIASYSPGMHDLLRAIHADAIRLLREGDRPAAAGRLDLGLRVLAHLNADPLPVSALTTHLDFNRTIALIRPEISPGGFDEALRSVLADGLERISRKDPFGYIGAVAEQRKILTDRLRHTNPHDEAHQQRISRSAEAIKTFTGDHLLYLSVIFQSIVRGLNQVPAEPSAQSATQPAKGDPLKRMLDVVSEQDIEWTRAAIPEVAPMLAQDDWDIFADRHVPAVAMPSGYVDRMSRARADLRDAMMLLDGPREATAATTRPDVSAP